MYLFHIYIIVFIAFLLFFSFRKKVNWKAFKKIRGNRPYLRSRYVVCSRKAIKVIFPHVWGTNAYTKEGRKSVPVGYSLLNSLQTIFILSPFLMLVETGLSDVKLNNVSNGEYITQQALVKEFKKTFTTKNGKTYPAKFKLVFEDGTTKVFKAYPNMFTKNAAVSELSMTEGHDVEVAYFETLLSGPYVVSLRYKSKEIISMKNALNEYSQWPVSYQNIILFLLVMLISAILKFKLYGYRNFYKRIKLH